MSTPPKSLSLTLPFNRHDNQPKMLADVVNLAEANYEEQISRAAKLLRDGKVVVVPTETVYGAAALLSQPSAVARLRALRGDSGAQPLTVHLADRTGAKHFLGPVSELGLRMMKKLWPGPVGLMFDVPADRRLEVAKQQGVAESDLYENGTITLRCPDHIVATDVIAASGGTVVAVLAAAGTSQPAHRAEQVAVDLGQQVDLILDAGQSRYNKPSTIVKVNPSAYEIVRAGVYDERIIERLMRTTILYVCSGNTCRSPMAEAITRKVLADKLNVTQPELEKKGIVVLSAGSSAMSGSRAALHAVDAVRKLGGDLSRHRSRPLSVELIHQADMIYAMSRNHAMAVLSLVPSAVDKVATLAPGRDIDDPIGSTVDVYQELAGELQELIQDRLSDTTLEKVL
jgi:tRNA threonylcarbamoyl adenosine modification protein (Sua5/YciO/YrdC/YwlC family)